MQAAWLVAASAGVILVLGLVHLLYTFHGPKLLPRDAALQAQMARVSPNITSKTTMWRAWVGFNASHSMGAILFGVVYLYFAFTAPALLFGSLFLRGLGLAFLLSWLALGWRYWFKIPFRGVLLALVLFAAGVGSARSAPLVWVQEVDFKLLAPPRTTRWRRWLCRSMRASASPNRRWAS